MYSVSESNNSAILFTDTVFPLPMLSICFLQNTDVNTILRVGNIMYFGTMNGLLYLDLFNQEWNIINSSHGLYDTAIWDMIEYNESIFLATSRGINELSIINHQIIPDVNKNFETFLNSNIYDLSIDKDLLYISSNYGLYVLSLLEGTSEVVSDRLFHKIKVTKEGFYGIDEDLWFIGNDYQEKFMTSNVHDFDICDSYIWVSKRERTILLDVINGLEWEYKNLDGIPGNKIYGINCDIDWVWFLTNRGLAFYNWGNYHNKKN